MRKLTLLLLVAGLGACDQLATADASTDMSAFYNLVSDNQLTPINVEALDGLNLQDAPQGSRPYLTARGVRNADRPEHRVVEYPITGSAAEATGDPETHPQAAVRRAGSTTSYLLQGDTPVLRVTNGSRSTDFPLEEDQLVWHAADGTVLVYTPNGANYNWHRLYLDGRKENLGNLGRVVLLDALGDTLLLGYRDGGRRAVQAVVR